MSTEIIVHHDLRNLPSPTDQRIPVQIYRSQNEATSYLGKPIIDPIRRLGVRLSPVSMDFLTIALAVTAADTFVLRKLAADGWSREIELNVSLDQPAPWIGVKSQLEKALHFLSGDTWSIQFYNNGFSPPRPYSTRKGYKVNYLYPSNCVSLFSGGIDSTVGVLDLLARGLKPTLISHAYRGDSKHQNLIASKLEGRFSRFSLNADPHSVFKETEISMRTRSLNFLAFAVIGCDAVKQLNKLEAVDLFVPENGFISLNAPLTPRRIGSLSTRTTHPNFMLQIQEIFDAVGINAQLKNPYQFQTKGEMLAGCHNQEGLKSLIASTVSCSHWKRKNQQCGYCLPCLVRRSAIFHSGFDDTTNYRVSDLKTLNKGTQDDLFAVMNAIYRSKNTNIESWIGKSGFIPFEDLSKFSGTLLSGLGELERFLIDKGLIS